MKEELNIAAILKEKPKGTKLYSVVLGEVELKEVLDGGESFPICVDANESDFREGGNDEIFTANGYLYEGHGEVSLFPSKQMRDWEKFAWKKGDVLRFSDILVIFEKWAKDDYTVFKAAYELNCTIASFDKGNGYYTSKFCKAVDDVADNFINRIEKYYGGKLNLETLEIEKQPKQEFKDGDKNAIVDLPKKCEFKPMDWCLMRDFGEKWSLCQFGFFDDDDFDESSYNAVGGNWYNECIPYNEETKHLLGTTDEWKGDEG